MSYATIRWRIRGEGYSLTIHLLEEILLPRHTDQNLGAFQTLLGLQHSLPWRPSDCPLWRFELAVVTRAAIVHPSALAGRAGRWFALRNHSLGLGASERAVVLATCSPDRSPEAVILDVSCFPYLDTDLHPR